MRKRGTVARWRGKSDGAQTAAKFRDRKAARYRERRGWTWFARERGWIPACRDGFGAAAERDDRRAATTGGSAYPSYPVGPEFEVRRPERGVRRRPGRDADFRPSSQPVGRD